MIYSGEVQVGAAPVVMGTEEVNTRDIADNNPSQYLHRTFHAPPMHSVRDWKEFNYTFLATVRWLHCGRTQLTLFLSDVQDSC